MASADNEYFHGNPGLYGSTAALFKAAFVNTLVLAKSSEWEYFLFGESLNSPLADAFDPLLSN